MAQRSSQALTAVAPACPNCGTGLGVAFIQQLAQPYIAQMRADLEAEVRLEARAANAGELAALRTQLTRYEDALSEVRDEAETAKRELGEARRAESQLRKDRRKLQNERDALEVEKDRMRDAIAAEERTKAEQRADERIRIETDRTEQQYLSRIRALEERNRSLSEEVEAVHRKASAGSRPQEDGVAYQHVFADELRSRFPADEIKVVARGRRGGDVVHTVRDHGLDCGIILWECKQTQRFEPKWVNKLTEDVQSGRADLGVLVSSVLPKDIDRSDIIDGILVCDTTTAVPLAVSFRQLVINAKRTALANAARGEQSERIYDYITAGGFGTCLARLLKTQRAALQELDILREVSIKVWANLEKSHRDMIDGLFTMVGEIEATGTALPPLLRSELPPVQPRSIEPAVTQMLPA